MKQQGAPSGDRRTERWKGSTRTEGANTLDRYAHEEWRTARREEGIRPEGSALTDKGFEVISHTADTGIRAYGTSLTECLANAARGMFSLFADLDDLKPEKVYPLRVEGDGHEDVLAAWLEELLFLHEVEGVVFCRFEVEDVAETHLVATAYGQEMPADFEPIGPPIKAVTYHGLGVGHGPEGWWAQAIFDV